MNFIFAILLFSSILNGSTSLKLTKRENFELKKNCGRFVRGYNTAEKEDEFDDQFKVLYGVDAKIGEAPWAVSLVTKKKDISGRIHEGYYNQHGTGSLISPYHVVTAAHLVGLSTDPPPNCETGDMENAYFMKKTNEFAAFLNVTCATKEMCDQLGRKETFEPYGIKSLYIRKGYVGDGCTDKESYNDLAVFELDRPVPFSNTVYPLCLPTTRTPPETGDTGYRLYGYGRDPSNKSAQSGVLRSLKSAVSDCSDELDIGGIFCTSAPNKGLSCDGDSGSGVVRRRMNSRANELAGVLSAGVNCVNLLGTHQQERRRMRTLTQETDVLIDVSAHLDFFCRCCGLCRGNGRK